MSAETLITASDRLLRGFRIDMEAGGLVVDETLQALRTAQREVELAEAGKPHSSGLLVAAKAACRDLHSDMTRHGGMVATSTEIAFSDLDKAIRAVGGRVAA